MTIFKDYGYKRIIKDYKWGEFEGNLQGNDKKINNDLTIRGKNYNLDLFFTSIHGGNSQVFIQKIQLFNEKEEITFEDKDKITNFQLSTSTKKNTATIFFKDINIEEYSNLLLVIQFSIGTNESYMLKQHFIKDFKEEEISFWDKLMGI